LNNVIEHSIQNRNEQLKKRGLSEEELKAKLEDAEELQQLKDHVTKYLRQMIILDAIAKQENIGVSQEDLVSVASSFQREIGDGRANLNTVVKEKTSTGEFQAAIQNVRDSRTIAKIIELANITEKEAPAKA
jgi:FKBP-type peptidyl-prolyl cis-trans isomerase (trigger factor)